MAFFLSLTADGKQVFSKAEGKCSGLLDGATVITHHSTVASKFTTDPSSVVVVHQLPVTSVLSRSALDKMKVDDMNSDLIRAEFGWLDEDEAPDCAEVALIIGFKGGQLRIHNFIVGGKSKQISVPLEILGDLVGEEVSKKKIKFRLDLTSMTFAPRAKATQWSRIEEIFKDSLTSDVNFAQENLYVRWRILEVTALDLSDGIDPGLFLVLEALPLSCRLELVKPELAHKYKSSSNVAIALYTIPLNWKDENSRKDLFTTPIVVMMDKADDGPTDSMIRLSMATVRDHLRQGGFSSDKDGNRKTVDAPEILGVWERCRRSLFMPTSPNFVLEVAEKGKYFLLIFSADSVIGLAVQCSRFLAGSISFTDPTPVLKNNFRIFSRGERLIFADRDKRDVHNKNRRGKYNGWHFSPPDTSKLLGHGAPVAFHRMIDEALAASIADPTKSSYSTAMNMLKACQDEIGRPFSVPLSEQDVLCFVAYMRTRNVRDTTIGSYLSGIKHALINAGYECKSLRTPIVNQVLKGVRNLKRDPKALAQKKTRRAMTISHLKLLGHSLSKCKFSRYKKALIWAGSTGAFWGSLRCGEIFCKSKGPWDKKSDFLRSDLQLGYDQLKVWIRSPKVASDLGDIVEIFSVKDKSVDPVVAMLHFLELRKEVHGEALDCPLFVEESGAPFTKSDFNKSLHQLVDPFLDDDRDSITGHSFRSGLATLMEAADMSGDDIMAWGRWSSEAFLRYCKEGRSRKDIFVALNKIL